MAAGVEGRLGESVHPAGHQAGELLGLSAQRLQPALGGTPRVIGGGGEAVQRRAGQRLQPLALPLGVGGEAGQRGAGVAVGGLLLDAGVLGEGAQVGGGLVDERTQRLGAVGRRVLQPVDHRADLLRLGGRAGATGLGAGVGVGAVGAHALGQKGETLSLALQAGDEQAHGAAEFGARAVQPRAGARDLLADDAGGALRLGGGQGEVGGAGGERALRLAQPRGAVRDRLGGGGGLAPCGYGRVGRLALQRGGQAGQRLAFGAEPTGDIARPVVGEVGGGVQAAGLLGQGFAQGG